VVVRFSRARKRYERQGILVEDAALDRAETECLADEDARARRRERDALRRADEDLELQTRMAPEIARLVAGCPVERAQAIARHASATGSQVCVRPGLDLRVRWRGLQPGDVDTGT